MQCEIFRSKTVDFRSFRLCCSKLLASNKIRMFFSIRTGIYIRHLLNFYNTKCTHTKLRLSKDKHSDNGGIDLLDFLHFDDAYVTRALFEA